MTRSEQIDKATRTFLDKWPTPEVRAMLDALALPPDPAPTVPAPSVKHFARVPWQAVCGADKTDQVTTAILDHTTCFDCMRTLTLESLKRVEQKLEAEKKAQAAPATTRKVEEWPENAREGDRFMALGKYPRRVESVSGVLTVVTPEGEMAAHSQNGGIVPVAAYVERTRCTDIILAPDAPALASDLIHIMGPLVAGKDRLSLCGLVTYVVDESGKATCPTCLRDSRLDERSHLHMQ